VILFALACGVPPAPTPPGGRAGGDGVDTQVEDTSACGTCTLIDCVDTSEPDATTEEECESEADDQECDDWEWSAC
jgi:hypothetical protein